MEIICTNFEQLKIDGDKIHVDEKSGEYYIIPLNKDFTMESDDEVIKLVFENQLLWLKYSNINKEILIKEFNFEEFVVIKSEEILDVYVVINTLNKMRKNVWQSNNIVNMNKKYLNKHFICIPIITDMVDIHNFDGGVIGYQIELITNEVLLKKVKPKQNNHGYFSITNNFLLNKDALFIALNDNEVSKFIV